MRFKRNLVYYHRQAFPYFLCVLLVLKLKWNMAWHPHWKNFIFHDPWFLFLYYFSFCAGMMCFEFCFTLLYSYMGWLIFTWMTELVRRSFGFPVLIWHCGILPNSISLILLKVFRSNILWRLSCSHAWEARWPSSKIFRCW